MTGRLVARLRDWVPSTCWSCGEWGCTNAAGHDTHCTGDCECEVDCGCVCVVCGGDDVCVCKCHVDYSNEAADEIERLGELFEAAITLASEQEAGIMDYLLDLADPPSDVGAARARLKDLVGWNGGSVPAGTTAETVQSGELAAILGILRSSTESTNPRSLANRCHIAADEIERLAGLVRELLPFALDDAKLGASVEVDHPDCEHENPCEDCTWYQASHALLARADAGEFDDV